MTLNVVCHGQKSSHWCDFLLVSPPPPLPHVDMHVLERQEATSHWGLGQCWPSSLNPHPSVCSVPVYILKIRCGLSAMREYSSPSSNSKEGTNKSRSLRLDLDSTISEEGVIFSYRSATHPLPPRSEMSYIWGLETRQLVPKKQRELVDFLFTLIGPKYYDSLDLVEM